MTKGGAFADKAYRFFSTVKLDIALPAGVKVMNPYREPGVRKCFKGFLDAFFSDEHKRILVFGINPSRHGAGVTGVAFTDPVALAEHCGIPNEMGDTRELSSRFVYQFIGLWGGPSAFYKDFFLTATCPLGFTKHGVNYNFYDHPALLKRVRPFIVASVRKQIGFGARRDIAIVLGTGKLAAFFKDLNAEHGFFDKVVAVEHPRFIMQYRRKRIHEYLEKYKTYSPVRSKTHKEKPRSDERGFVI